MKNITINVDDLGLSTAVNQAVVELATQQRINSTSFMSLGEVATDELNLLKKNNIAIGLHLDFTELSKNLLGFSGLKALMKLAWLRQLDKDKVRENIELQLDLFEEKIGQSPFFIDGHQHIHQFPTIREILLESVRRRYSNSVMIRSTKPVQAGFKANMIYRLGGAALDKQCLQAGIRQNNGFAGVYDFRATEDRLARLWEGWLSDSIDDGLVMCHPAIKNDQWRDSIKQAREVEFAWLSSERFLAMINRHQVVFNTISQF